MSTPVPVTPSPAAAPAPSGSGDAGRELAVRVRGLRKLYGVEILGEVAGSGADGDQ